MFVGVIDVGFRQHPRIDAKVNHLPEDSTSPSDDNSSHGLHVLSIIGATDDIDCPIKGIAPNVTFFTYAQSVPSRADFTVILEKAEALDDDSKNVCMYIIVQIHNRINVIKQC